MRQRDFFEHQADDYDNVFFRTRWPRNQERKAELLVGLLEGGHVLELGCGTGQIAELMLARDERFTYFGVDLSPKMVARAAKRLERFGRRAEVAAVDGETLPVESGSFDAAFGVDVLHHIPDPVPTLRELRRVLRPGAPLVFLESNPKFPVAALVGLSAREEWGVFRITRRRLRRWFDQAGLADCRVSVGPLFTPPGPPALTRLFDRIDMLLMRIPVARSFAIFFVASGRAPLSP